MQFTISTKLPASPEQVYTAWLCKKEHSQMIGVRSNVSDKIGASFTAGDGYITGKNIKLEPYVRIVQAWRTTEFVNSHEDSILELTLKELDDKTVLTLTQTNLTADGIKYKKGWKEHYFMPMKAYFKRINAGLS